MVEYDKDAIVYPYITEFLRKEIPERRGILKELEDYAEKNSVPIVQPETAKLLETLMCLKRPARILEVGCAIVRGLGKSTSSTIISLIGNCVFRVLWILVVFNSVVAVVCRRNKKYPWEEVSFGCGGYLYPVCDRGSGDYVLQLPAFRIPL